MNWELIKNRINEIVEESGMTKRKFVEKMGFTRKILMPSYKFNYSTTFIVEFCKITGVSSDYILGLSDKKYRG